MDNRSGFGEEDDNNTGEVEESDGKEVLSVRAQQRVIHYAWRNDLRRHRKIL